jgi:hypothetical protein
MDADRGKELEFFIELRDKMDEISDLVDKYDLRQQFVSAFIFGISDEMKPGDEKVCIRAVTGMTVVDEDELDVVLTHLYEQFNPEPERSDSIDFWLKFGSSGEA